MRRPGGAALPVAEQSPIGRGLPVGRSLINLTKRRSGLRIQDGRDGPRLRSARRGLLHEGPIGRARDRLLGALHGWHRGHLRRGAVHVTDLVGRRGQQGHLSSGAGKRTAGQNAHRQLQHISVEESLLDSFRKDNKPVEPGVTPAAAQSGETDAQGEMIKRRPSIRQTDVFPTAMGANYLIDRLSGSGHVRLVAFQKDGSDEPSLT